MYTGSDSFGVKISLKLLKEKNAALIKELNLIQICPNLIQQLKQKFAWINELQHSRDFNVTFEQQICVQWRHTTRPQFSKHTSNAQTCELALFNFFYSIVTSSMLYSNHRARQRWRRRLGNIVNSYRHAYYLLNHDCMQIMFARVYLFISLWHAMPSFTAEPLLVLLLLFFLRWLVEGGFFYSCFTLT